MKKLIFFPYIFLIFLLFTYAPLSAQDSSGDSGVPEEVEAATNPAGQVPDEIPNDAANVARGRSLFGQQCAVCHAVGKQVIGPALASVHNRRPLDWLVSFIQNSQEVIQAADSGDYEQVLFEQYNRQVMPNFDFLSRDDIINIMAYIKAESVSTTSGVSGYMSDQTESSQEKSTAGEEAYAQRDEADNSDSNLTMIVGGVIVALLLVIVVLLITRSKSKQEA